MINPDAKTILSVRDLHASVDGTEILKGLSLDVIAGEVHAFMVIIVSG